MVSNMAVRSPQRHLKPGGRGGTAIDDGPVAAARADDRTEPSRAGLRRKPPLTRLD
jgi:hypothetical protein